MELLRISIENVLFHLSELFTYLNKVILLLGQRGSDNRGRTVPLYHNTGWRNCIAKILQNPVQCFASWLSMCKVEF